MRSSRARVFFHVWRASLRNGRAAEQLLWVSQCTAGASDFDTLYARYYTLSFCVDRAVPFVSMYQPRCRNVESLSSAACAPSSEVPWKWRQSRQQRLCVVTPTEGTIHCVTYVSQFMRRSSNARGALQVRLETHCPAG